MVSNRERWKGGEIVLANLQIEMERHGVTNRDIARLLGKSERTVRDKISGRFDFSVSEARKIRDAFFPNLRIEYLFAFHADEKHGLPYH